MATTSGTTAATNAVNNLLSLFRTWITVTIPSNWTQEEYTAGATENDQATLSIRGPGAGADRRVFVNMRTLNSGGNQAIEINAATNYSSSLAFDQQEGVSPSVFMLLNKDTAMAYRFFANDRRFVIMSKVGTSYIPCHAGFFLPFATPEEYPFPLYVAANYPELAAYTTTNVRNRSITDPGYGAAYYKARGISTWKRVANHGNEDSTTTTDTDAIRQNINDAVMWPHGAPGAWNNTGDDWSSATKGFDRMRQTAQGEAPLFQCHIIDPGLNVIPGALDGIFGAVGHNRTADSTATSGGDTYRFYPNITRVGSRNIWAIEDA